MFLAILSGAIFTANNFVLVHFKLSPVDATLIRGRIHCCILGSVYRYVNSNKMSKIYSLFAPKSAFWALEMAILMLWYVLMLLTKFFTNCIKKVHFLHHFRKLIQIRCHKAVDNKMNKCFVGYQTSLILNFFRYFCTSINLSIKSLFINIQPNLIIFFLLNINNQIQI